jgi:glycosyltransferase involved in cell wall biosynthesis
LDFILKNDKKHVLVVMQASSLDSPYLSTGGVDTVSKTLLEGFKTYKSESFKYSFLIFDPLNQQAPNSRFIVGEHTCYIENFKSDGKPSFIYHALLVRKYINLLNPDIVHCHQDSWIIGAAFKKIKKIVSLHGYRNICRKPVSFLNDYLYQQILPDLSDCLVDLYSCVSESFRQQLPENIRPKTAVVYNPISLNFKVNEQFYKNYSQPVLIFTGLLIPRKQVEFCVDILLNIRNKNIDAVLLIAGPESDPIYVRFLKDYINKCGLDEYVKFVGHLDANKLNDLYNKCHFGLSFSRQETFGLVPLEMCSSGLIVFSTAVGVLSEAMLNSDFIYTYNSDDSDIKNKVSEKIVAMCLEEQHENVKKFNLDKFAVSNVIISYEKIYSC